MADRYHTAKEIEEIKLAKAIMDSPEFKRELRKIQNDMLFYGQARYRFEDGKLKHVPIAN